MYSETVVYVALGAIEWTEGNYVLSKDQNIASVLITVDVLGSPVI